MVAFEESPDDSVRIKKETLTKHRSKAFQWTAAFFYGGKTPLRG